MRGSYGIAGARGIDRQDEFDDLGAIGGVGQDVHSGGSGASMGDIVHHFIERKRLAVVEEGLRKREEGEQRRWDVAIRPKRRRGVLADFVESRRVEGADATATRR